MALHVKNAGVWKPTKKLWTRQSGIWTPVRRAFVKQGAAWKQYFQDEVVAQLVSTGAAPVAVNHFSAADWANPLLNKRLIIPAGQEIGTNQGTYALAISGSAQGQAGSFAGDLIIDNYGTISGLGGLPNSGQGGTAVWGNLPGRDGRRSILNNYGTIRGGGGGGGRGGTGGTGVWYDYQDTGVIFVNYGNMWVNDALEGPNFQYAQIYWGGVELWRGNPGNVASVDLSGYRYEKHAYQFSNGRWRHHAIRRYLINPIANYTPGGAGGSGGRGQGYDGGNAGGAAGAAGGTNAGAGGTGGWGMHYGGAGYDGLGAGLPGAAGASGNYAGGSAGASGGAAGFYLNGLANITFNNFGTVQGRIA